ncbi:hypothetical protein KCU88_g887, partial [Aureobasidium melanogenum]
MKRISSTWLGLAAISCLILTVTADSVTKCGNSGDSSYYNSTTLPYVFYNNPWGNDGSGYSCITGATTARDDFYQSFDYLRQTHGIFRFLTLGVGIPQVKNNGTAFDATWRWTNNSDKVHAYPHFKLDSSLYPLSIKELAAIDFGGTWAVNVSSAINDTAQERLQALDDDDVQYNVALDMFLDANASQATQTCHMGIDGSSPDKDQFVVGDTRFFLFHGTNDQNQTVFSWLAETNLTTTGNASSTDFSPLVHYLWQFDFMPADLYLGTVQFGTETYHASPDEVLFRATDYSLGLSRNESQNLAELNKVDAVSVPSQVPTMERFKSGAAAAAAVGTMNWLLLICVWAAGFVLLDGIW